MINQHLQAVISPLDMDEAYSTRIVKDAMSASSEYGISPEGMGAAISELQDFIALQMYGVFSKIK